jgi:hypothetical protein
VTGGRLAECVRVTTPFGSQINPVNHPILTASGWLSYASILEIYSIKTESIHLGFLTPPVVSGTAILHKPASDPSVSQYRQPKKSHTSYRLGEQSVSLSAYLLFGHLDQKPLVALAQQLLDRVSDRDVFDAQLYLHRAAPNFQYDCPVCFHFCDALPQIVEESARDDIPSPACVASPCRADCTQDVQDSIPLYIPGDGLLYEHYYHSGEVRQATEETIYAPFEMTLLTEFQTVYDITVDEVNHYITHFEGCQGESLPGTVNVNTLVGVDEAPTFPFIATLMDRLKGSMRSPAGVPCQMFLTGNPGGSWASVIKLMFIDRAAPNTVVRNPEDGTSSIFIKSTIYDNKILVEKDPKYVNRLMSISDPLLRAAWLEGRWDVFVGQAFDLTERHQIDPIWPIPQYAPIYMTFDWGFGAPFSIGWWWVDADGRGYRFAEWYGWNEVTPNVGLRLTDPEIAEGILEHERKLNILGRKIVRVSGPDCFSRKPNYLGGGQGPSTAEEMQKYGERPEIVQKYGKVDLTLIPGDADRKKKIRQFRKYLSVPRDSDGKPTGEMPMIMVYKTCRHFLRIIPQFTLDDTDLEDLEDHQEDHPYDETCHFCMIRPLNLDTDEEYKAQKVQKKVDTLKRLDNASRAASQEFYRKTMQVVQAGEHDIPDDMAPELYGLPGDMDPEDIFS